MATDADLLMKQAGYTAEYWLHRAKNFVEETFKDLPPTQRTTLIAAYVQAAALDEGAMSIRDVAKSIDEVASTAAWIAQSLGENQP